VLRLSTLFLRTLRDNPADAELPSHKLLIRAGMIRRVAPGIYSWLPLGLEVLHNIERIVREEMNAMGAQEVHFPALIPREVFEASGRYQDYYEILFKVRDRKDAEYVLGPTHEELFTLLVKGEYSSYKDYPLALYQIQTKYRDEARPRAGILRAREFVMKDSYSFDLDDAGLARSYRAHRDTYERIFTRMGLTYKIVFAVSGAMGGSDSEEFLAPTPFGEDTFVQCVNCDYAANTEAVVIAAPEPVDPAGHPGEEVLDTPDTPTIDTLVTSLNRLGLRDEPVTAADTLKNVVLVTHMPGTDERELLVVGVPGDREVDLKRINGQLEPVVTEQARPEDLAKVPALVKGYIGPQHLSDWKVHYLVDPLVVEGSAWVTGANAEGKHAAWVVRGRDFTPDGEIGAVEIRNGDRCAHCGGELEIARGIEMGHVFALGRKYAETFGLQALDQNGEAVTITMGSYGVGVTRAVAAIAEQTYDDKGLCWPREVAPADVHIVATGKDAAVFDTADRLAADLTGAGVRVLYDDRRDASPGVKFADAELLGVPTIIVVGRGLSRGVIEVRDRRSGDQREVDINETVATVVRELVA
jgi:prolyl-tRNA synthetase